MFTQKRTRPLIAAALVAGLGLVLGGSPAAAAEDGKDFTITVDGVELGISAGDSITARSSSGAEIKIKLVRREYANFKSSQASFEHLSKLAVASTDISKDIRQHLVTTGRGTIVLVQEYAGLDPSSLAQLMLTQLVKDDIAAGAKMTSESASRKLSDGTELNGLKAKVASRTDEASLEVMTLGKANQGVIVLTRIDQDNVGNDQIVLDRFWSSLKLRPIAE